MSQALGNAYRSILEQHCRGRAGDLIKQTYCVWADRSMWPPQPPPPQTQCIFTAGQVVALCRVGLEQGSTYSLHQQQKPKNSGRDGVNTVKNILSTQGTVLTDIQESLDFFFSSFFRGVGGVGLYLQFIRSGQRTRNHLREYPLLQMDNLT